MCFSLMSFSAVTEVKMTLNLFFKVCAFFVLTVCLKISNAHTYKNTENIVKEIIDVLDNIDDQNHRLKSLVKEFANSTSNVVEVEAKDNCLCVPFYLCFNGTVVKDGSNILQPRMGINPCPVLGDICCEPYQINLSVTPTTTNKISVEECGYSSDIKVNFSYPHDKTVSKFGEFPWTVMISDNNLYLCVGSLIHPKVVLTACHCVKDGAELTVRAGEWNTTTRLEPYEYQIRTVKSSFRHPGFVQKNLFYNVALLVLETPFKLDINVRTICLADEFVYQTGQTSCSATGWGTDTPGGSYKRVMKKINYSLLSNNVCEKKLRKSRLGMWYQLHKSFVCATNEEQRDLCTGDGGGPLVCPIEDNQLRFIQVGITSWGLTCNGEYPSVFTDISYVKTWIDSQMEALKLDSRYYTP